MKKFLTSLLTSLIILNTILPTNLIKINAEDNLGTETTQETTENTDNEESVQTEEIKEEGTGDFFSPEPEKTSEPINTEIPNENTDFIENPIQEEIIYEINYPVFNESKTIDNVLITVKAPEGVFPEGSILSVKKVPVYTQQLVDSSIEEVRKEETNVAISYTFDIKVLDAQGVEIQPKDMNVVEVNFTLQEAKDSNLNATVYHTDSDYNTNELETKVVDDNITVETDSFSFYTVEFTYDNKQYVLHGGYSVKLEEILSSVGLSGEVESWQISNTELFNIYRGYASDLKYTYNSEEDEAIEAYGIPTDDLSGDTLWMVALQPFTTTEWLKVTIDGKEYHIDVTDSYSDPLTGNDLSDRVIQDGDINNFTSSMPLATIFIDEDVVNMDLWRNPNYNDSIHPEILYTGTNGTFGVITQDNYEYPVNVTNGVEVGRNNIDWPAQDTTTFDGFSLHEFVLDAGTIKAGQDNKFDGPIMRYTIDNAAEYTGSDGVTRKGNVVITYSNLNLVIETTDGSNNPTPDITLQPGYPIALWDTNKFYAGITYDHGETRMGITVDVNVKVVDQSGQTIDGNFLYPVVDVDIDRSTNSNFGRLHGASDTRNYSEQIELTGGYIDKIWVPNSFKEGITTSDGISTGNLRIFPSTNDNNTFDSGFITLANNTAGGISTKIISNSALSNSDAYGGVESYILTGSSKVNIKVAESTDEGGKISASSKDYTEDIEPNGTNRKKTITAAKGQTVQFTMTPNPGYKIKNIYVSNSDLDILDDVQGNSAAPISMSDPNLVEMPGGIYYYFMESIQNEQSIHVEWEPSELTVIKNVTNANDITSADFDFRLSLEIPDTTGQATAYVKTYDVDKNILGTYEISLANGTTQAQSEIDNYLVLNNITYDTYEYTLSSDENNINDVDNLVTAWNNRQKQNDTQVIQLKNNIETVQDAIDNLDPTDANFETDLASLQANKATYEQALQDRLASLPDILTKINGEHGKYKFTLTYENGAAMPSYTFDGVVPYGWNYKVEELDNDGNVVNLTNDFEADNSGIVWKLDSILGEDRGTLNANKSVEFVNDAKKHSITICKDTVESTGETFDFQIKAYIDDLPRTYYDFSSQGATAKSDNYYQFSLSNGGSKTFTDIPVGYVYEVRELTKDGWKLVNITTETSSEYTLNEAGRYKVEVEDLDLTNVTVETENNINVYYKSYTVTNDETGESNSTKEIIARSVADDALLQQYFPIYQSILDTSRYAVTATSTETTLGNRVFVNAHTTDNNGNVYHSGNVNATSSSTTTQSVPGVRGKDPITFGTLSYSSTGSVQTNANGATKTPDNGGSSGFNFQGQADSGVNYMRLRYNTDGKTNQFTSSNHTVSYGDSFKFAYPSAATLEDGTVTDVYVELSDISIYTPNNSMNMNFKGSIFRFDGEPAFALKSLGTATPREYTVNAKVKVTVDGATEHDTYKVTFDGTDYLGDGANPVEFNTSVTNTDSSSWVIKPITLSGGDYEAGTPGTPAYTNTTVTSSPFLLTVRQAVQQQVATLIDTNTYEVNLPAGASITIPDGKTYKIYEDNGSGGWTLIKSSSDSIKSVDNPSVPMTTDTLKNDTEVTFTNDITKHDLTITKETINNDNGNFNFEIKIWKETTENLLNDYLKSSGLTPKTDENNDGIADDSIYTFTLANNESKKIEDIPYGYNYEVYEVDSQGNKVLVGSDIGSTDWKLKSIDGNNTGIITQDTEVTFTNELVHDLTIKKETTDNTEGSFNFRIKFWFENEPITQNSITVNTNFVRMNANTPVTLSSDASVYNYYEGELAYELYKGNDITTATLIETSSSLPSAGWTYDSVSNSFSYSFSNIEEGENYIVKAPDVDVKTYIDGSDTIIYSPYNWTDYVPDNIKNTSSGGTVSFTHEVDVVSSMALPMNLSLNTLSSMFEINKVYAEETTTSETAFDPDSNNLPNGYKINKVTDGTYSFTLTNDQSINFEDLPHGVKYEVYEETQDGWRLVDIDGSTPTINKGAGGISGTLNGDTSHTFNNIPLYDLKVTKKVSGNMGNKHNDFNFTASVWNEKEEFQNIQGGTITNWDNDEPITITTYIPARIGIQRIGFSFGENEGTITDLRNKIHSIRVVPKYSPIDYVEGISIDLDSYEEKDGMIFYYADVNENQELFIEINKMPQIGNGVTIHYGIKLMNNNYVDLTEYGGIDNGDGTYSFKLQHNDSITIPDLPYGTKYEVYEDDYSSEGYTTTVDGNASRTVSGTLTKDTTHIYTNRLYVAVPTEVRFSVYGGVVLLLVAGTWLLLKERKKYIKERG